MKKIFILAVIATIVVTAAVGNKPFTGEESILNLFSGLLVVFSAFGLIYDKKVGVVILAISMVLQIAIFGVGAYFAMAASLIVLLAIAKSSKEVENGIKNFINRVLSAE